MMTWILIVMLMQQDPGVLHGPYMACHTSVTRSYVCPEFDSVETCEFIAARITKRLTRPDLAHVVCVPREK